MAESRSMLFRFNGISKHRTPSKQGVSAQTVRSEKTKTTKVNKIIEKVLDTFGGCQIPQHIHTILIKYVKTLAQLVIEVAMENRKEKP